MPQVCHKCHLCILHLKTPSSPGFLSLLVGPLKTPHIPCFPFVGRNGRRRVLTFWVVQFSNREMIHVPGWAEFGLNLEKSAVSPALADGESRVSLFSCADHQADLAIAQLV